MEDQHEAQQEREELEDEERSNALRGEEEADKQQVKASNQDDVRHGFTPLNEPLIY